MYEEDRIRWSRNYGAALASVNTVLFFLFGLVLHRIHVHIRTSFDAESLRSASARIPMDQQDGNIYAANYAASEGSVLGQVDLSMRSAAMPQPSLESYMGTQASYMACISAYISESSMSQPRGVRAPCVTPVCHTYTTTGPRVCDCMPRGIHTQTRPILQP